MPVCCHRLTLLTGFILLDYIDRLQTMHIRLARVSSCSARQQGGRKSSSESTNRNRIQGRNYGNETTCSNGKPIVGSIVNFRSRLDRLAVLAAGSPISLPLVQDRLGYFYRPCLADYCGMAYAAVSRLDIYQDFLYWMGRGGYHMAVFCVWCCCSVSTMGWKKGDCTGNKRCSGIFEDEIKGQIACQYFFP